MGVENAFEAVDRVRQKVPLGSIAFAAPRFLDLFAFSVGVLF
jgi:hypothetical protein